MDSFRLTKNSVLVLIGGVNDVYDNCKNYLIKLQFWNSLLIETLQGLNLNGFRKGLLAKQVASLIYEISGKKNEEPISLKWKMELN